MGSSLADYSRYRSDPEEQPFLLMAERGALTEAQRSVYADLLLQRGDHRGRLLALSAWLRGPSGDTNRPEWLVEYRALVAVHDGLWWQLLTLDAGTFGCGRVDHSDQVIGFSHLCGQLFIESAPTDDPNVRSCGGCDRQIHLCTDRPTAEHLARAGQCIAITGQVRSQVWSELSPRAEEVGDIPWLWALRIFVD